MQSEYLKGFLLTALGVLVLSFDALMIRLIHAQSFDILFWRRLFLALVTFFWCKHTLPKQPLFTFDRSFVQSSVLFVCSTTCFVCAVNLTSVANVLVIISAQPLFAAVMA